ncbi:MAG: 16S rRNA (guanine(966)-N(2))-methyltransferase RsmD [Candidatus Omnitrophica bacterium]|nr:16S rRNA (guanine(966)-N(2))-methyltransferase RsmD [Candidatus Omnitrophota bacterium]
MKIIGGTFKNRNIYMPRGIRPTQHIVRKSLFDILGQDLTGYSFLDLCAGSGSIGIEALSRGSEPVLMVEKDQRCFEILQENLAMMPMGDLSQKTRKYEILNLDAFTAVKLFSTRQQRFDLVFCDPPYGRGIAKKILKILEACDILHPNCTVIMQHQKKEILPEDLGRISLVREKKYGSSRLSIYEIRKQE